MFDFDKPVFENAHGRVLVCAHRGVSGGNIPCNTLAAYKAALLQGADIIELDVTKSADGEFFVFHPGMEPAHLGTRRLLGTRSAKFVRKLRFVNQDDTPTQFGIEKLEDVLSFLKGKCYINVDKFWTDIPGITEVIRRSGVEKQVIVKTGIRESYLSQIKKYAPDLMFMPVVRSRDDITDKLVADGIRCVGAEVLFSDMSEEVASPAYIKAMHEKGRLLFVNSIVYDYKEVLSAGHTDDEAVTGNADFAWGELVNMGFDIIQTDWCLSLRNYLSTIGK